MCNMKRLFQVALFIGLFSVSSFAKGGFGDRLFFQVGGTIGADVMNMTGVIAKGTPLETEYSSLNVNYATLALSGRVNLLEISNNSSLGLTLRPSGSFGRAYNDAGGGSSTMLRLPFTFDFHSGAAATVATRAKTGFTIGVGAEYVMYPLGNPVAVAPDPNGLDRDRDIKANWLQPVVVAGIKFTGKHYYCREINFKASFSTASSMTNSTSLDAQYYGKIDGWQTVGFMVSFMQFLNY